MLRSISHVFIVPRAIYSTSLYTRNNRYLVAIKKTSKHRSLQKKENYCCVTPARTRPHTHTHTACIYCTYNIVPKVEVGASTTMVWETTNMIHYTRTAYLCTVPPRHGAPTKDDVTRLLGSAILFRRRTHVSSN